MAKESETSGADVPRQDNASGTPSHDPIAALAEALKSPDERWLVNKGDLDYGPYTLAEVVTEIRADTITPGHLVVDKYTNQRVAVEHHPLLVQVVSQAKRDRDHRRRTSAEDQHATLEQKRGLALYAVLGIGCIGLVIGAVVIVSKVRAAKSEHAGGVQTISDAEISLHFGAPGDDQSDKHRTTRGKRTNKRSGKRSRSHNTDHDDTDTLDFGQEGGDERLDNATIHTVIRKHSGRLGGCMRKGPERKAKIRFSIRGSDGKVTSVKVNGDRSGSLYSCINRSMRAMKFPTFDGSRTRAVFDMSR